MLATILTIPSGVSEAGDELFRRFTEVPGVLHAYQLEPDDNKNEVVVVSIWESQQARDAYMKSSPLKQDVDRNFPQQARRTFRVRNHK